MELSSKQQIFELIKKSKNILLVTKTDFSEDSISSMLALGLTLEKMGGHEVDMVCSSSASSTLSFLPSISKLGKSIDGSKNFVITLDTSKAKVAQFSYDFDEDGNKLNIYITPEKGNYDANNVITKPSGFKYSLIICVDVPDLEKLGKIYEENTELFYETPIINIDSSSSNEQYGEVNLVDVTASSTAEVVYSLLESFGEKIVDEEIANCLLTGIISSTKSFQTSATTPKAFTIAAQLIALGADQQKIIKSIFKNKSLSTLKLWGRALARVKFDDNKKIAWTLVNYQDFEKTGSKEENDILGVEEEIAMSVNLAEIVIIFYEFQQGRVKAIFKTNKDTAKEKIRDIFMGKKVNGLILVDFDNISLLDVEKVVLEKLKQLSF
ncbi:MAG: DHH family phosphoesterase [Patescibacteria group bacterium]|nr:DHH family phosphoesterase [Patescibacteria group bacterium]